MAAVFGAVGATGDPSPLRVLIIVIFFSKN